MVLAHHVELNFEGRGHVRLKPARDCYLDVLPNAAEVLAVMRTWATCATDLYEVRVLAEGEIEWMIFEQAVLMDVNWNYLLFKGHFAGKHRTPSLR